MRCRVFLINPKFRPVVEDELENMGLTASVVGENKLAVDFQTVNQITAAKLLAGIKEICQPGEFSPAS